MPRTRTFEAFKNILPRCIRSIGGKKKYSENVVFFHWAKIVGEDVAQHVRPDYFSFYTLVLATDSPVWANQLLFMSDELKEKINAFVGMKLVKTIRFSASAQAFKRALGPKPSEERKELKTSLPQEDEEVKALAFCADIKDEELKAAASKALAVSLALHRDRLADGWHKCKSCEHLCPPDEDCCESCHQKNKQAVRARIRELLDACPWSSYAEIYSYVPCTAVEANSQRARMVQQLARRIVYGDFESLDAKRLVMLADCVPPQKLTEERIKRVMRRYRFMLAQEDKEKKNAKEKSDT